MARGTNKQDATMLAMALVGYELEKKKIDERIKEIRAALSGKPAKQSIETVGEQPKRRKLSAAARKRIAVAQKKRWAEHRKALAAKGA
jgi:CHASE3 domain sensor protein